jgi:hypothetical protein
MGRDRRSGGDENDRRQQGDKQDTLQREHGTGGRHTIAKDDLATFAKITKHHRTSLCRSLLYPTTPTRQGWPDYAAGGN